MKKNVFIVFSILLYMISCSKANAQIKWEKTLESAIKKAKSKNMPIMIDVYTDWCTWCKELDKNTYANKKVIDMAKKMVSVKLNPETSKEGEEIAAKYGVKGYPTVLFINADGIILENVGGYIEGEKFVPYMQNALNRHGKVQTVFATKEPTLEKLDIYIESSDEENAKKIYDELMAKNAISVEKMPTYILGFGLMRAQKEDYNKAIEYFNTIIKDYPNSEEFNIARYYYAVTMILDGKKDEAIKYIESLLKDEKTPEDIKKEYEGLLEYAKNSK